MCSTSWARAGWARSAGRRGTTASADLLALDEAIEALAAMDPRKAKAVELRFFGGLEMQEIAVVTAVSLRTVQNDLRMAQAWLKSRLGGS